MLSVMFKWADFRLSTETVSLRQLLRTSSCLMNTCVAVDKALFTLFKAGRWWVDLLYVGLKPRYIMKCICKGGSREAVKNIPGRHSVPPYTISAAVEEVSSLSASKFQVARAAEHPSMRWHWAGPSEQLSTGNETALPCHLTAGDKQLCMLICSRAGSSVPATNWIQIDQ